MNQINNFSYILLVSFMIHAGIVKPQNQLNIAVTSPVRLGQNDIRITCVASGTIFTSITSYSIFRNDSTPTLKALVTRTYNVITQTITTTWPNDNQNVQGRAVLSGNPLPFPNASFVLTIPRAEVICPGDDGGYQCQFSATVSPGSQDPIPVSTQEFIEIETTPSQMNPITVLSNNGNGNVPVTNYGFSIGTVLTLQCTGTVGKPIQFPRWCHKKTSDFRWQSPDSGVFTDAPVAVGCQNSITTTYIHNVTTNDNDRMFLCEAGSNPQCGFGVISSNITMFLLSTTTALNVVSTMTLPNVVSTMTLPNVVSTTTVPNVDQCKEKDTSFVETRGNIMFGIGLTTFLLALAMFTAMFILYQKKLKGERNELYETAMPTHSQARSENHNYSTLGVQENYVTVT